MKTSAERARMPTGEPDKESTYPQDESTRDLQRLEQNVLQLNLQLAERDRIIAELRQSCGDILPHVSHELRTPMTVIKEVIDQVLSGYEGEVADSQRHLLTIARKNIDRLGHIIHALLEASKLEAGQVTLSREPLDVGRLVRDVAQAFLPCLTEKGLDLRVQIPEAPVMIIGDRARLTQVFTNLLGNALKFTDRGFVEVAVQDGGLSAVCLCTDTGCGIPADERAGIFGKFYQPSRRHGPGEKGVGLGLAIAKGIVELHQGRIEVTSIAEPGTQFKVTLPKA